MGCTPTTIPGFLCHGFPTMHSRRGDPSRLKAPRSPTSPADAELGEAEKDEKDEPRKRQRLGNLW